MLQFASYLRRAALALALAGLSAGAMAGPTYHVSVNTNDWIGQTGALDFMFGAALGAPGATATISHVTGGSFGATELYGDATGTPAAGYSLYNTSGVDEVLQWVTFGGTFGFDVTFGGEYEMSSSSLDGSSFWLTLLNENYETLGAQGPAVTFDLLPAGDESAASVSYAVPAELVASVTDGPSAAVPEASQWAIFLTGLGLMAWTVRRRQQR